MRCGANPFAAARCAWGARDFDWAALQQCHSEVIGNNSVWEIPEHIRSVEKVAIKI